ncbi:unnamed protein product [Hymenolepis diminuta]|uniref:Uncharacterized protein n=1 Tax=Hymenolepis diminuta TaxID=6216 RepID=A0A0R3SPL2_HYMDI|nr:unnamed protein product [Hymenolepis diminuta]
MATGVKIANLTCDSVLSDSDAVPVDLVHKMSASVSQPIQFVSQLNPCRTETFITLSTLSGLASPQQSPFKQYRWKRYIKKAVAHKSPPVPPNRPPTT